MVGLTLRGPPIYPPNGGANVKSLRKRNPKRGAFSFPLRFALKRQVGPGFVKTTPGKQGHGGPALPDADPPNGCANVKSLRKRNPKRGAFSFPLHLALKR